MLVVSEKAHAELSGGAWLRRVVGGVSRRVAAYEALTVQACSGLAVAPPASVPQCVATLLDAVVRRGFWSFLAASDVLVFAARYGTGQFCQDLVLAALRLVSVPSFT